ncbi:hypothetical protein SKAU_G00415040 [Synaphobranchus kaupii]|uniref:Reverse transcriptase RNase H-like domain-containing protein n=1 Tax=Synaphobranchus kaupii TaxID=118154 RepID=A0A9Q1IBG2_SYNKA|nr:hypothetical protein SKAU_G00415040 [Synaphobranchus kaupii]
MPSPFPTLCNQCPSLRAKINELEGRISNLYSIREDEILIDSLAAASRIMEATDLESSAPCFPPAADRDRGTELGAKPKSPACSTPIVSAPWSTVPTGRRRGRRTGRPLPREKLSLENRYQVLDELSRPEQATPSQPRSRGSAVPVSAVHRGTMHPPVTAHPLGASQPLNGAWTRPSRSIVREKPPRVPPTGPPTTLVVGSSMVRHLNFFSAETLKLNRHQKNYSTIEKEALALVVAVQHFEVSSVAGEVLVYSDHNPLSFLARFQSSNAQVFRWSLILQPYALKVKHIASRDNVIADALSQCGT